MQNLNLVMQWARWAKFATGKALTNADTAEHNIGEAYDAADMALNASGVDMWRGYLARPNHGERGLEQLRDGLRSINGAYNSFRNGNTTYALVQLHQADCEFQAAVLNLEAS